MTALRDRLTDLLQRANPWPTCPTHPKARLAIARSDPSTRTHTVACTAPHCTWEGRWPFGIAVADHRRRAS